MSGSTDHSLSDESACDFNTVFEKLCGESNTASLTSPQLFTERHQKESKIELADLHRAITEGKNVAIATSLETKAILEEFTSQHTMLDSMKTTVESNTKTLSTMRTDLITRIDKLDKNQKESLLQIAKAFKKVEVNTAQEGIKTRKHNAKTAKETQKKNEEEHRNTRDVIHSQTRTIAKMVLSCTVVAIGISLLSVNPVAGFVVIGLGCLSVQLLPSSAIDRFANLFKPSAPPAQVPSGLVELTIQPEDEDEDEASIADHSSQLNVRPSTDIPIPAPPCPSIQDVAEASSPDSTALSLSSLVATTTRLRRKVTN